MIPDRNRTLTIFGRMPVLECLRNPGLQVAKVHLASSNKPAAVIDDIIRLASARGIAVRMHDKQALSRISRNGRQDQGVAADVLCPGFADWKALLPPRPGTRIIALDRINNPQNLGMVIRSVCAAGITGLLLSSERGNTGLSPLVVKASAGTVFGASIYRTERLADSLAELAAAGYQVMVLAAGSGSNALHWHTPTPTIMVLGNESEGVSDEVAAVATGRLHIPMANGVDSLNVAVTAGILAFLAGAQPAQ